MRTSTSERVQGALLARRAMSLSATLATALAALVALSGCLYVGSSGEGWHLSSRSVAGDWRQLDMHQYLAYSDTWFVVDSQQRGTVKGFPTGGVEAAGGGGYFELSVIARVSDVPVQQVVRVYFDQWTSVYVAGERNGTVLAGLTSEGFNVVRSGRMLEVPFHVNGGRMNAERVNVLEAEAPRIP
jgi:hypothetical protein